MEEVDVNSLELPGRPAPVRGVESTNLRDLLKVRDDEATTRNRHRGNRNETMTLATVLACEKQQQEQQQLLSSSSSARPGAATTGGRTLLDVIRLDEDTRRIIASPVDRRPDRPHHGISWKTLKSLLCLRRVAALRDSSPSGRHLVTPTAVATTSPTDGDNSDIVSIDDEVGLNWAVTIREHMGSEQSPVPREGQSEGQPIRVSLMALLEEADRNGGGGGPSFASALMGMVEEDEEEEEEEEVASVDIGGKAKGRTYVCCVCMVRHKGAAFIPCGHTFCRLCSRELWVSRGICPLCNGFILEILDIF